MFRKLVIFALLLVVWSGAVFAQGAELTCDGALVEAQAAYDNGEKDTAWALAAQAEILCLHDNDLFRKAQRLRSRSGLTRDWLAAAEPGRVDLDDTRSLFLACQGEGSPIVIFEHGFFDTWMDWGDIQPAVSTVTRTCAYTRAAPPSDEVRTTQDQVDDLIALLEIAEIEPPYILAGHGIAGFNLTLFTEQYTNLVRGIVLVDGYHPEFFERAVENPSWLSPGFAVFIQRSIDNPLEPYIGHLDILASGEQAAVNDDFGDIPTVVLTAGRNSNFTEEGLQVWIESHKDFASWSTNSRHVIAGDSGHRMQDDVPEIVIEEILWVLDEARATED